MKMVARRMAAWMPETLHATAPAETTPAIDRHWAMASEILAKTKGKRLDCRSSGRTRKINLPTNQKGYDTFETTVGKLSARRIQIYPDYFCLGIILKVILNNFQNNA